MTKKTGTMTYAIPILIQIVGWNGLRKAATVGGTFFGAT